MISYPHGLGTRVTSEGPVMCVREAGAVGALREAARAARLREAAGCLRQRPAGSAARSAAAEHQIASRTLRRKLTRRRGATQAALAAASRRALPQGSRPLPTASRQAGASRSRALRDASRLHHQLTTHPIRATPGSPALRTQSGTSKRIVYGWSYSRPANVTPTPASANTCDAAVASPSSAAKSSGCAQATSLNAPSEMRGTSDRARDALSAHAMSALSAVADFTRSNGE